MTSHTCSFRPGPCDHSACDPSVMNADNNLISGEEARTYSDALLAQVGASVGEGTLLSDDAVSMMSDLAVWVRANT